MNAKCKLINNYLSNDRYIYQNIYENYYTNKYLFKIFFLLPNRFTYNPFIPQKIIGWAPDQLAFENIMRDARESLKPMKLKKFKNCQELKKAILEDHLFCGVCLKNEYPLRDNTSYHYHGDLQNLIGIYPRYMCFHMYFPNNLRFYHDSFIGKTWETHAEFSLENKNRPRNILAVDGGTPGYVREGFVHIQQALNLAYLNHIRLAAKSEQIIPNIYIRRFPERNYIGDDVLEKIDFGFSFMIIFSKLILILDLVTVSFNFNLIYLHWISDKQKIIDKTHYLFYRK